MKALKMSLFLLFLVAACDDDTMTSAQLTAQKLKKDINSANILSVSVVNIYDGSPIFIGSTYKITSDGFIVVTTDAAASATFNLGELKSYQITPNSFTLFY